MTGLLLYTIFAFKKYFDYDLTNLSSCLLITLIWKLVFFLWLKRPPAWIFDNNYILIPLRDPDINDYDRRTYEQYNDFIRVLFLRFEVQNPKNEII